MRDLLREPLCHEEDLGSPVPDSDYGVSVCLPRWEHVLGYEKKDPQVVSRFRSGYPRFCCPPAVGALFQKAEAELAREGERCLVFPEVIHAQRCLDFMAYRSGERSGRVVEWTEMGLGVAVFPGEAHDEARRFWRFCGEIVSTRQAVAVLSGQASSEPEVRMLGDEAIQLLRRRLADLAGQTAEEVFLFPSGMAANYAVHRMLTALRPEAKTVQLDFPYVDVLKLQQVLGKGAHFVPLLHEEDYEGVLRPLLRGERLAGVFAEAPSNPLLRCVHLPRVREMLDSEQAATPLVVDDTVATVVNVDACRYADVVTTSLTKAFSGVGDVLAGALVLNRRSRHYERFAAFLRADGGHGLWAADAVALERNSRGFVGRVLGMNAGAMALVEFLRSHPAVRQVWHASHEGGAGYEAIRREQGGYGGLFSLVLHEAPVRSPVFYDRLRVSKGPSLGTEFTLACPYTLLAHYDELDWAESCGVSRDLIRVSTGLEPVDDLIGRFAEALSF
jgi:cystathionine gamma-synthase